MKKAITHCLIKFGIDHLVYFSRIGVVGCGGLSDCEELVFWRTLHVSRFGGVLQECGKVSAENTKYAEHYTSYGYSFRIYGNFAEILK